MEWAIRFNDSFVVMKRSTPPPKKKAQKRKQPSYTVRFKKALALQHATIKKRTDEYLNRRPHRSFRRTYRRDYVRSLKLPGYWAFTLSVGTLLKKHWRTMLPLLLIYAAINAAMVGVASQSSYIELRDILQDTGGNLFEGAWGQFSQAGLLALSVIPSSITPQLTDVQQVYAGFVFLLTWLSTVWLLRSFLAGQSPRLRDGLYNSGAPILPTFLLLLVLLVQLVPVAIAAIGFSAATVTGILSVSLLSMLFWLAAVLLSVISLYWITSTFIALVVITLPGMYPWQALRVAGDLVTGRRIRILLRLGWMALIICLVWTIILIPTILAESWLRSLWSGFGWLNFTPVVLLLLTSASAVWMASYVYLLYRKVVDDDASPA